MTDLPTVQPIVTPNVDWDMFVRTLNEKTKRSPTRNLDATGRRAGDYYSFITSLGEFVGGFLPRDTIRNRTYLFRHLQFSFLICGNSADQTFINLIKITKLSVIDNSDIDKDFAIIVSGNLEKFYHTIITLMVEDIDFTTRYVANSWYFYFSQIGLGEIFYNCKPWRLSDGTYVFERSL